MFLKQPIARFVLATIVVVGVGIVTGVIVSSVMVGWSQESLSSTRAEVERLGARKARLDTELQTAQKQRDEMQRELIVLKSTLESYRVQTRKADRDKQTALALLKLKSAYENGAKQGTYIDAEFVGARENSLKVALKSNDGSPPSMAPDHPDAVRLFQIVAEIPDLRLLTIRGFELDRRHLDVIRACPSIGYLELSDAGLEDEAIKDLFGSMNLWGLNLSHNPITNVPPCPTDRLVILDVQGTGIGDEEVLRFAGRFPKVEHVNLTRTKVTDAGIRSLAPLVNLRFLEFSGVSVGDLGLAALSPLTKLKTLRINDTNVSDLGVRALDGMNELETVFLSGTRITDEGLSLLAQRPKLSLINVERTAISDDGLVKFSKRVGEQTTTSNRLTVIFDQDGRRDDLTERMKEACPRISIPALKK
jgi:Leucine Rich repeat